MSQKAAAQPAKEESTASEAVTAVKQVAPKPQATKKAVVEKPAKQAAAKKVAPVPKAPAKSVKKAAPAAKSKVVEAPKAEKAAKVKKPKLVRDSFTLPEGDYALFATLKQRALAAGIDVKKSELLRASLTLLANLADAEFAKTIGSVERIKTGRPKK